MVDQMFNKVVTIDGPSAVGKGTASRHLAYRLGWNLLDSGALYRIVAYIANEKGVSFECVSQLVEIAQNLKVDFVVHVNKPCEIIYQGLNIASDIRSLSCGQAASTIAVIVPLREALLGFQRSLVSKDGLVADGRDMGSVVFPSAPLKFFLTASAEVRAHRRFKELRQAGSSDTIGHILRQIETRDQRDRDRKVSPLIAASDAIVLDTSDLAIEDVVQKMMVEVQRCGLAINK